MSEPDNFISRWSRRKLAPAPETPAAPKDSDVATPLAEAQASDAAPPELFDIESLPSLESITAETDIRAFMQPGVPLALRRDAMRRIWAADPAIRDFVGLADYDFDFNTPGALAGFGPLEGADIPRLLREALGHVMPEREQVAAEDNSDADTPPAGAPAEIAAESSSDAIAASQDNLLQRNTDDALALPQQFAALERDEDDATPLPRGHGSALPR